MHKTPARREAIFSVLCVISVPCVLSFVPKRAKLPVASDRPAVGRSVFHTLHLTSRRKPALRDDLRTRSVPPPVTKSSE